METKTEQALKVLVEHLEKVRREQAFPRPGPNDERSPAADEARDWCHKLLNAADAEGLGGCDLCQG